jgi:hypothetical protein
MSTPRWAKLGKARNALLTGLDGGNGVAPVPGRKINEAIN